MQNQVGFMMNFSIDKKYLALSCFQKCIRRGETNLAQQYAKRLYEIDQSHFLMRLGVCLIEDVSFGNIDLVHEYLSTEIKKKLIEEKGGLQFILNLVEKACNSPKDKTPWSLVYGNLIKFHHQHDFGFFNQYIQYNENEQKTIPFLQIESIQDKLIDIIKNENNPAILTVAHQFMIGNAGRSFNRFLPKIEFNQNRFDQLFDMIAHDQNFNHRHINFDVHKIKDIVKISHKIFSEDMFIGFSVVLQTILKKDIHHFGSYQTGDIFHKKLNHQLYTDENNNQWISSGIDKHCYEGASCLHQFLKLKNIALFNQKNHLNFEESKSLWSQVIFHLDGGLIQNQLIYKLAIQSHQSLEQNLFNHQNFHFSELKSLFVQNMDDFEKIKKNQINNQSFSKKFSK